MLVKKNFSLIAPYGGRLVNLMVPDESFDELKAYASQLESMQISPRSVCDLELMATGAFSPLDRFMGKEDYQRTLDEMRLADGHISPIPITLPVRESPSLQLDQDIALRNSEYELMGIMTIEEIYEWDRTEVADKIFGTRDLHHPLVAEMQGWGTFNISGRMQILHLPRHFDFQDLRLTPAQARAKLADMERGNVVSYVPPNSLNHVDDLLIDQIIKDADGTLLLHPATGLIKLGDVDHYTRIHLYKALVERYSKPDQILLALLPLVTRMAGLREALWQALISRNYGANHMIISLNHATLDITSDSITNHKHYDAQELMEKYSQELGVKMMPQPKRYQHVSSLSGGLSSVTISNTRIGAEYPSNGHTLSGQHLPHEIIEILSETYMPRHRQGVCIWFTGLSGSGKSTTAEMLTWLLLDHGRRVTVLDGDVVRTHLSKGLGFSKEDRDTNVRRIGFVASELVRLGGVVICAVVSPYRAARNQVRNMMAEDQFVEVFVNTPLEVCEARDVKGLYAKARRGELKGLTGIDDPYEAPDYPEIKLDTVNYNVQDNANFIIDHLVEKGFIRDTAKGNANFVTDYSTDQAIVHLRHNQN
jgi:sulfate adenylyltransferase